MGVVFFESRSGRCYVEEFLRGLSLQDRAAAAVLAVLADIEELGFEALGCRFRQIGGKLWEIKIRAPGTGYRIFYVTLSGGTLILLHAYKKKSRKAPPKEIKIALKRMKEVLI
jgi:phage-related protein